LERYKGKEGNGKERMAIGKGKREIGRQEMKKYHRGTKGRG
jgi:hypothetical protein